MVSFIDTEDLSLSLTGSPRIDLCWAQSRIRHFRIERTFPLGNDNGSDTAANHIHYGSGTVRQTLDTEEQNQAGDGDCVQGRERGREGDKSGSCNSGRPFRREHQYQQEDDLVAQAEMRVGGLGDEERTHAEVDGRAVRVERVAGRHDHADHGFGTAESLQLDHQRRQDRFG
jgi:hypothetical protein